MLVSKKADTAIAETNLNEVPCGSEIPRHASFRVTVKIGGGEISASRIFKFMKQQTSMKGASARWYNC
jgi:hypothetical protein